MTRPADDVRAHLRLYVIVDPDWCAGRDPADVAAAALAGGATCLQLRHKSPAATDRDRLTLAVRLRELAHEAGAWFLLNDRLDLALAADADGVHLGPDDLPVEVARRLLGPTRVIGASAASPDLARAAEAAGADYLGVGALYDARAIKKNASAPRGAAWIATMRAATRLPMVGIGGISVDNAREVLEAGADGVAVVRAVCAAPDPERAAEELTRLLA